MSKLMFFILSTFMIAKSYSAQHGWGTTVINGKRKLKIGARIQTVMSFENKNDTQDLYIRRLRLNVEYHPWENHTLLYDIRNDSAGRQDRGNGTFEIGDAIWTMKVDHPYIKNLRFLRSKVDVSYSQTTSSRNLINPFRAEVTEHASDFVIQDRRATNIQINGSFKQLAFHFAIADGVNSNDLEDINGLAVENIPGQKLTYGGKLRYFFIGDARKNSTQDTFYGFGKSISIGAGHFANDKIMVHNDNSSLGNFSFSRQMTNIEISIAYHKIRMLGEAFQFQNDLMDLTQTNKNNILGDSSGHYLMVEYVKKKWAPYIRFEEFNRNNNEDDFIQESKTIGLNYYKLLEAIRFGMAWTKKENGKNLGLDDSEELYTYAMLNF